MQEQTLATVATIFSDVLANQAFMFVEEDFADSPPDDTWMETTIGYRGTSRGELALRCTVGFAGLLAENLLGSELNAETARSDAENAVQELMNIVCGHLVTALHGTDEVFNLTIPETRELNEAPDLWLSDKATTANVCAEGFPVQLSHALAAEPAAT